MTPRTALISANIGSIDPVYPPVKQTVPYDLFYYTENNLPFPLPSMDNRMKGKYIKTQFMKFIEADYYIWVDGSIEIDNPSFIEDCVALLQDNDMVMVKHPQRENVYEELEYIIDCIRAGDRYLMRRYVKQPLFQEYQFYKSQELPKDWPLFQCSFFACKRDIEPVMNDWWDYINRYSNFDQSQFNYVSWKHQVKIAAVEADKYFLRHKHLGYNL